jgi:uncharacterized membrane protein YccC
MPGQEAFLERGNLAHWARPINRIGLTRKQTLEHCARTAITAVVSMLVARVFVLPQSYWAPITTLVSTQSSLGSALTVSWQRFIGTVLGAAAGVIVASYFGPQMLVFGTSVFLLGLFCAAVQADRSAYRLGGVTLTIVLLVPRTEPPWQVAFHRFAEVSVGIVVALVMTVLWPERDATSEESAEQERSLRNLSSSPPNVGRRGRFSRVAVVVPRTSMPTSVNPVVIGDLTCRHLLKP